MKCFYPFKDKFMSQKDKHADQEVKKPSRGLDNPVAKQEAKSSSRLSLPRTVPEMYKEKEQNLRVFSLSELRDATNGFSRLLKIGEGGFGSVYKGKVMPLNGRGDPIEVAIKKLNRHGLQGHKEWLAEVQFLGIVEHHNLVKLLGYSATEGERGIQLLLVYEYMPNKSLDDHLFNRAYQTLPWKTRLEVILGAAQGLAYLHEGLEVQVIYRDFKSSNVLLDEHFKAKLSDFGLAREGPAGDHTHVSTAVVGTYGYAAPDYVGTGHLTTKSDVYSFGVVLYEILTGRRALERSRPTSEQKLLEWVKLYPIDSKKFVLMIDPQMGNKYPLDVAREIAKLADNCLLKNPKDRPTMRQVVETLDQALRDSVEGNYLENGSGRH